MRRKFRKMQPRWEDLHKPLALRVIRRHVNGGPRGVAQWLEHRSPKQNGSAAKSNPILKNRQNHAHLRSST